MHYLLEVSLRAVDMRNRLLCEIPAGAQLEIGSEADNPRMVTVRWAGGSFLVFRTDIEERGSKIREDEIAE